MKISLPIAFVTALFFLAAFEAAAMPVREYTVIGDQVCKDWVKNAHESEDPDNVGASIRHAGDRAWMVGYASGVNRAWSDENLLRGIDYYLLSDWTDKYCESNPTKSVSDAVDAMFKKLKRMP